MHLKKEGKKTTDQSEIVDLGSHISLQQHDMCPKFLQKSLQPSAGP